MAIESSGHVDIDAPAAACFAGVSRVDRYGDWARDVERVTVLERDAEGHPLRADVVVDLFGKDFSAILDLDPTGAPTAFGLRLVEARKLRSLVGHFTLEPSLAATRLTFTVKIELLKPKAPRIERMAARRIETAVTRDLRRHVERQSRAGSRRD